MTESSSRDAFTHREQRREARRNRDPHHLHPFRRIYIGPSPVSARTAVTVAAAIAQDAEIEKPTAIGVVGGTGTIAAASFGRTSHDSVGLQAHQADAGSLLGADGASNATTADGRELHHYGHMLMPSTSRQSLRGGSASSSSPARRPRELSPLRIPRSKTRPTRLQRDSSFASVHSRTGSMNGERLPPLSYEDDGHGILHKRSSRRQMSQSLVEPRAYDHESVKFNLQGPRPRRQLSEGSTHHDVAQHDDALGPGASNRRDGRVLPLLDVSVDEESRQDSSISASPQKTRTNRDRLFPRSAASHRPVRARSIASVKHPIETKRSDSTMDLSHSISGDNAAHSSYREPTHPPTVGNLTSGTEGWTGNGLTATDSTTQNGRSRLDEIRERARERYRKSRVSQNAAFSSRHPDTGRRQHIRDASRQSRMSYLSAAGTLNSVGTRFTEGSFGATGGFRAKLIRSLGLHAKQRAPTTQSVHAEARRHGRRSSLRGGVVPGAVGTSAGGTKWIGQTFEVGKRFWQTIENREELLLGDTMLEDVQEEESENDADKRKRFKAMQSSRQASEAASMTRSPSDVISTFARRAGNAAEGDVPVPPTTVQQKSDDKTKGMQSRKSTAKSDIPVAPALVVSGSDSEPSDGIPATPDRPYGLSNGDERPKSTLLSTSRPPADAQRLHALERVQSTASLMTVPQDREALSGWDIENRNGWTDVVSFISAQSNLPANIQRSARSAGENINEIGNRAKRALDGQLAEFRARQSVAKQVREKNRSDTNQTVISEASRANDDGGSARQDAQGEREGSVAINKRTASMKPDDVLKRPEPPLGVEEKFAEATFELTRRPSLPGVIADGMANDAASDHEVAARPTFDDGDHEQSNRATKEGMEARKGDTSPMEIPSVPVSEETTANGGQQPSILQQANSTMQTSTDSNQRKMVQFQSAATDRLAPPQRSTTVGILQQYGSLSEEKASTLGGRLRPAVRSGDSAPAPPEEVLSREATPDERTTSFVLGSANETEMITSRSALKRDRMLVKVAWTPSEDVPKEFTERQSRKYELHADPFREYMVVYRSGRLELWDDPSWTSRLTGQKDELKLRLVAPLRRGRAFISLYSPIDTIFCLSFVAEHHRSLFNLRRSGTHIWLFDARAASNAADWMWELWRELGGQIPDAIDVHIPIMGSRIRIPIPEEVPILQQREKVRDGRPSRGKARITSGTHPDSDDDTETAYGEGFKVINVKNVGRIVMRLAHTFPQWSELCARLEQAGIHFGLAWRTHTSLTWIQHSSTTSGDRRDWAVLVGSILCDSKAPSTLEFRSATHYPQTVQTPRGGILDEPPAVEGFLWRVKAVSGALMRLYVTSQDGLMFINRPSRAFPPERYVATERHLTQLRRSSGSAANLSIDRKRRRRRSSKTGQRAGEDTLAEMGRRVLELVTTVPSTIEELDAQIEAYRAFEKRRLFEQINNADGYIDLCDIWAIKCLDDHGPARRPGCEDEQCQFGSAKDKDAKQATKLADGFGHAHHHADKENAGEYTDEDDPDEEDEDIGGEEGYELAKDRAALKRSRQVEVIMSNGRAIRFEAYSRSLAREWVDRLADLARYWKRREKVDALELMNASGYDPQLIQRKLQIRTQPRPLEQAADSERLAPLLGNIWNWCILDGCRTLLRSGRLFTKKKPYAAFANRYCILVSGRLLTYKLMTSNRTARARQNAGIFHKRQDTVIHLRDSYVYSGKLTDHMLVNGRSDGAGAISNFGGGTGGATTSSTRHTLPRVYADGLLSIDEDEECTFVIRYRPQRVNRSSEPHLHVEQDLLQDGMDRERQPSKSPSLTALRNSTVNVIAMRARSRMERDLWVWAINAERERLVREDKQRESQIRQHGQTPYRSHH